MYLGSVCLPSYSNRPFSKKIFIVAAALWFWMTQRPFLTWNTKKYTHSELLYSGASVNMCVPNKRIMQSVTDHAFFRCLYTWNKFQFKCEPIACQLFAIHLLQLLLVPTSRSSIIDSLIHRCLFWLCDFLINTQHILSVLLHVFLVASHLYVRCR